MDILCERCGEPWDIVTLAGMTPDEARRFKRGLGCPCCYGKEPCDSEDWCDDCPEFVGSRCQLNRFYPRVKNAREIQAALRSAEGKD